MYVCMPLDFGIESCRFIINSWIIYIMMIFGKLSQSLFEGANILEMENR